MHRKALPDVAATSAAWAEKTRADPEIGGANLDAAVKNASAVIKRFGMPALHAALNKSAMGNHPELVRLLSRVGKELRELGADDEDDP